MIILFGYLMVGYVIPVIVALFVLRFANEREKDSHERIPAWAAFIPLGNIVISVLGLILCPIVWLFEQPTTKHFLATLNKFVNYK